MRNSFCLALLISCFAVVSYAQDCDAKLKTARDYKTKKDFKQAVEWYNKVLEDCGDFDGKVINELKECAQKATNANAEFVSDQPVLECPGDGGAVELALKKAPENWSISQAPTWVQMSSVILEESKAVLYIGANPKAEIRVGVVQLTSEDGNTQEFTLIQFAGAEWLSIQSDNLSFDGKGGRQTVNIDANFKWSSNTTVPWLQLSQQNEKLSISCSANDLVVKRNATVTISGKSATKSIQVTQSEGETQFSISGSKLSFEAAGGENNSLKVNCNDTWQVKNDCQWLIITPNEDALVVQCEANPWAESRKGSFEVITSFEGQKKTISVEQSGAEPRLDRISLPSMEGERSVSDARPHFRSVFLKGNKGEMKVKVHSNVQTWDYIIVCNGESWITAEAFPKDSLLKLKLADNNEWNIREADVIISAMGIKDTLRIRQNKRGYQGVLDDYFDGGERVWKTSRFFIDVFAAQSNGFRIGGLSKRWKFVEFSLLDFSVEFDYDHFDKQFNINWEPIIRGYLPLSRSGNRWAAFIGMGTSVNLLGLSVAPTEFLYLGGAKFLFEIGAEFHWLKKDNISSRIFYRYNGYSSVGISFDFYKWTKKYGINQ